MAPTENLNLRTPVSNQMRQESFYNITFIEKIEKYAKVAFINIEPTDMQITKYFNFENISECHKNVFFFSFILKRLGCCISLAKRIVIGNRSIRLSALAL